MIAQLLLPVMLMGADTGDVRVQHTLQVLPSFPLQAQDRWFGEDKLKHFALSYIITAGSAAAARTVLDGKQSVVFGASLGVGAGIAKELYDRRHGTTSARDLLWDAAGVTAAVLLVGQAR